jgi:integrase/recombinase XerC
VTSENTGVPSEPRRRGAQPTALPREYADFLAAYTGVLADVPLAADTKRTYVSRVRMYLAWLASPAASRRSQGDPLVSPRARDWAVRDYRFYLLRDADPKRSIRYSNNALAALDDFHVRLGLGKAEIGRDDLPKTAPRALDGNAQIRWLRAVEDWPHARDQLLALLPFYAGLRVGDAVALDVPDVRMSARKGVLVVYGKGGKVREVPIHPPAPRPAHALARRTPEMEARRQRQSPVPQPPWRSAVRPRRQHGLHRHRPGRRAR